MGMPLMGCVTVRWPVLGFACARAGPCQARTRSQALARAGGGPAEPSGACAFGRRWARRGLVIELAEDQQGASLRPEKLPGLLKRRTLRARRRPSTSRS
jgi:hypothetical protein